MKLKHNGLTLQVDRKSALNEILYIPLYLGWKNLIYLTQILNWFIQAYARSVQHRWSKTKQIYFVFHWEACTEFTRVTLLYSIE